MLCKYKKKSIYLKQSVKTDKYLSKCKINSLLGQKSESTSAEAIITLFIRE